MKYRCIHSITQHICCNNLRCRGVKASGRKKPARPPRVTALSSRSPKPYCWTRRHLPRCRILKVGQTMHKVNKVGQSLSLVKLLKACPKNHNALLQWWKSICKNVALNISQAPQSLRSSSTNSQPIATMPNWATNGQYLWAPISCAPASFAP